MAICSKCSKKLPDNWGFPCCPFCGSPLTNDNPVNTGAAIGDANAFAGDVSISTNITNNITRIERNKTDKELKAEAMAQYRELCKAMLADGIVTTEENTMLIDAQTRLGLTRSEADHVLGLVKAGAKRSNKSTLGKVQQISLNQVLKLMETGKTDSLSNSLGRLEAMAERYDADEVQCNYWMVLSAMHPDKCINKYKSRETDNYWQTFWTVVAYINKGDSGAVEGLLPDLEAWSDMPFGNIALLAAANSLNEYWNNPDIADFKEQAQAFLEEGGGECTDLIDRFSQALALLMDAENATQIDEFHDDFVFQLDCLLGGLTEKIRKASARLATPPMPKIDLLPESE